MEDIERIEERLANIRGVKPILGALRMIALGSWQAALKQRRAVQAYGAELLAMLPALLPHVRASGGGRAGKDAEERAPRRLVLVVGSERGLCGRFNTAVFEFAQADLQNAPAAEVQLLGRRLERVWAQAQRPFTWAGALPFTTAPPYALAHELTTRWLAQYEAHAIDAVHVIYNRYRGTGLYETAVWRMLPPRLPRLPSGARPAWPPPIIETAPPALYAQIIQQWAACALFGILLESAAAEQAARYQLMESATQNAERLIAELTASVQVARQQTITREMLELAAGAGLIEVLE
jgi:F-type H+-transporting ATPase subunit gamma